MSRRFRSSSDPAFDDADLADARDELVQGTWEPARELLETAAADWDRRSHRIGVLAEAAAGAAWVEQWQLHDPRNRDVAVLRAQVEVVRVLRSATGATRGNTAGDAERHCRRAAELAPEDPTPWVSLVTLARAQGSDRNEFWQRWQGVNTRDRVHRDGFHQALIFLFDAWYGSHAEMYDFAYWVAGEAPPGSPLAILPLVAHAESYRYRFAAYRGLDKAGLGLHWTQPQVGRDIDVALERWLNANARPHAQAMADRNYLLHALIHADRWRETRSLFEAIGPHLTRIPWTYTGDPETAFAYWRKRALGAG
jgi:hypothetical protein